MRLLATPEYDIDLDFVALSEKFLHLVFLKGKIMSVSFESDAYTLGFNLFLFSLGDFLLFGLLIEVFPVIHDLAYGGMRLWGNFNQIEASLLGDRDGFKIGDFSKAYAILINDQNAGNPDALVGSQVDYWRLFFLFETKSFSNGFISDNLNFFKK